MTATTGGLGTSQRGWQERDALHLLAAKARLEEEGEVTEMDCDEKGV